MKMPNIKTFLRVLPIQAPRVQLQKLVANNLAGGMDTLTSSVDLDNSQFVSLQNIRNLKDSVVDRDGSAFYTPLKPDSLTVLGFFSYIKNDGTVKLLRFTPSSIFLSQASSWLAITGASLTGGLNDWINVIVANDRCFFTNNGVDVIQEFLPATNTVAVLGDAPKYKYVTAFGDRLVGFNLAGASPNASQVGWCGNLNYPEWNSITDQTSGFQTLENSSSDLTDPGTGIFSLSNTMILVRERSIWEATTTGSFSQPFSFYTLIPGVGSDSPRTIKRIPNGIAFLDSRTRNVYTYTISAGYTRGSIASIGDPIKDDLLLNISDPVTVFAEYNVQSQEYMISIPNSTTNITKVWKYSFLYKTWSFDYYPNLTSMDVLDFASGTLDYADLTGSYSGLIGTYASLGAVAVPIVTKFLGYSSGELSYEKLNTDFDAFGGVITKDRVTKDFEIPSNDMYLAEFRLEYDCIVGGSFNVYYSKDSGTTWYLYNTTSSVAGVGLLYKVKKQLKTRKVRFQIVNTSGIFKFKEYELWVSPGADSRS